VSKAKVVGAHLEGFGAPLFPPTIDLLNTTLAKGHGLNGFVLEDAGRVVEGFVGKDRPTTTDGYTWFWALTFVRGEGTIVVCFPWAQDWDKQDASQADRSVAVYSFGADERDVAPLVADLVKALAA